MASRPGSSAGPNIPPPPRSTTKKRRAHHNRGYSLPPRDKSPPRLRRHGDITILLCVFHSTSHKWSTEPLRFNPDRTNDRDLWMDIREIFRQDIQKPWRRILGFKKVTSIVPIAFSPNGVPLKQDPKDFPESRQFMHAYHHPEEIRPDHRWVDWFVEFDADDTRQNGLEFVEGLWADKLAAVAILATVAIIVVSIVWCVKGGELQTVFTVMSFVLSGIAAEIALAALYYQVTLPG